MHAARRPRFALWIAFAAILWASIVPSFAQVLMQPSPAKTIFVDLCVASGHTQVAVQVPGDDESQAHREIGMHCPFCRAHDAYVGVLPAPLAAVQVPTLVTPAFPPLFYLAHTTLFAWTVAHPRGPPALG